MATLPNDFANQPNGQWNPTLGSNIQEGIQQILLRKKEQIEKKLGSVDSPIAHDVSSFTQHEGMVLAPRQQASDSEVQDPQLAKPAEDEYPLILPQAQDLRQNITDRETTSMLSNDKRRSLVDDTELSDHTIGTVAPHLERWSPAGLSGNVTSIPRFGVNVRISGVSTRSPPSPPERPPERLGFRPEYATTTRNDVSMEIANPLFSHLYFLHNPTGSLRPSSTRPSLSKIDRERWWASKHSDRYSPTGGDGQRQPSSARVQNRYRFLTQTRPSSTPPLPRAVSIRQAAAMTVAEVVGNPESSSSAPQIRSMHKPDPTSQPFVGEDFPQHIHNEQAPPGKQGVSRVDGEDIPNIYQNLQAYLLDEVSRSYCVRENQNRSFMKILRLHSECKVAGDMVFLLAKSHRHRTQLMQISLDLGVSENPGLLRAIKKDEAQITHFLHGVLSSDNDKRAVLRLKGEDAENFMTLMLTVLETWACGGYGGEKYSRDTRRLLVRLSEACGILPPTLSVEGVKCNNKEQISGGGFSDIFFGECRGRGVALKRLRVFSSVPDRQQFYRKFCKEALIWQQFDHPNILPFMGIDAENFTPYLAMVSPWMRHGTLRAHIRDTGYAHINRLILEIAQGLEYLHLRHVVHGDLRGANILIDDDLHARLADFGLAEFADATMRASTSNRDGAVRWMAPELHDHTVKFQRTCASDVFAFACVCLEVYTDCSPFVGISHLAVPTQILKGVRPSRPTDGPGKAITDHLWNVIERCWCQKPSDRLTIRKVIQIIRPQPVQFLSSRTRFGKNIKGTRKEPKVP